MFSALSKNPLEAKAKQIARVQKGVTRSARLRRAMSLPTVLPINRWDLF